MFQTLQKNGSRKDAKHVPNQNKIRLITQDTHYQIQRKPICPCGGGCPGCIQTKLKISQPNNIYEQEADRVAEHIISEEFSSVGNNEPIIVNRKISSINEPEVSDNVTNDIENMRGGGIPLEGSTRKFMESRFGYDFENVRIHADERAARSANLVNARAYTVGNDIIFGRGEYSPHTKTGQKVLAHEIVHVIQQRKDMGSSTLQRITYGLEKPEIPQMEKFRSLINEYVELKNSNELSAEEILEIDRAVDRANTEIHNAQKTVGKGNTLLASAGTLTLVSGSLAADDVTVVGVVDDAAIPFTLLAAGFLGLAYLATRSSPLERIQANDAATQAVADAVTTIATIVFAVKAGEKIRGLTSILIVHLARILGVTVSGQPPDHQGDPERDKNKWWKEIKNFVKQIRDQGLSPKQMWRELTKKFTTQQITEMREALRRAAELMKEDPPDFPQAMP